MSCDEAVVRKMGSHVLAYYTASLLSLATGRHVIAGMPLAFGGGYQGTHPQSGKLEEARNWGNFDRSDCLRGSGNLPTDQSTRAVAAF